MITSLDKAIYKANNKYENLLEFTNLPDDLVGYNLKSIHELNDNLAFLCNRYRYINDPYEIKALNEAVSVRILDYIQRVSEDCQRAWDNFKKSVNTEQIIEVVNKQNQVYFTSGFRMQFPKGYTAPMVKEWYRIRDNVKLINMDPNTYNSNKQYMENEAMYKSHFYRNWFNEDLSDDFYPFWKQKVFVQTTGKEVIAKPEIVEYVNFLLAYNTQIEVISKDIDVINTTNKNFKTMITQMPANEAFEVAEGMNQILNELGSRFKDAYAVQQGIAKSYESDMKKEMERQAKRESKNDKKYIMTYYMSSMDIISSKIKICNAVKNQSLKILKHYIALQPKSLKTNPEQAAKYAEMQARRAQNPNFQIKK